MRRCIFFFLFFVLIVNHNVCAQSINRSMLIGNWTQYVISDTSAYSGIPDNLKTDSTVRATAYPITNTFELNADSTFSFYTDWMIDGVLTGKWRMQHDTLVLRYNYANGTTQDEWYQIRPLDDGKFEWTRLVVQPGSNASVGRRSFVQRRKY